MSHSTRNIIAAFVASPGDVADERRVAREVVEELNESLRAINWQIDLLGWEDTLPGAARPQELINKDVDACDLFIGILWRRWGQPTGEYSSGFEEEFERARKRRKDTDSPEIWLSFKKVDPELLKDPGEQLKRVIVFRQSQVELREVLFKEFTDGEDWRTKLRNWLLQYVLAQANQSQQAAQNEENVSAPQPPTTDGPNFSTLTQDSAVQPAYAQLEEIFRALSDALPTSPDNGEPPSAIELTKVARLNLFSTALISSRFTHEVLQNHLMNYLYLRKEQLEAIKMERDLLFRTIIGDQAHVQPGWYWFRDLEREEIESVLFETATLDEEAEIRSQALRTLKDAGIKATKEATKEFIRYTLKEKEASVLLASLHYFGWYGDTDDLPEIEPLFKNENFLVREAALLARFRIVARRNITEAFAQLVTSDLTTDLTEEFSEFDVESKEIENDSLIAALSNTNASIRLFALKELSRRGDISTDNLQQLRNDSSKQVKQAAYAQLVRQGESVDVEQLLKAFPDEKSIRSHFFDFSYPSVEPSPTLLAFYRRLTFDELLSKLEYYSTTTPLVLRALAKYHFDKISDLIRTNLADDFESLRTPAIERYRVQYAKQADDVIAAFKGFERFIKDGLIAAALASLADSGEPTDVELARKHLNSSEDYIRFEAIRIIERFGDASDVEPLLNIFRNSYGNLKNLASAVAVKLSPGINGAASALLQSDDPTFVRIAITAIWNEDKEAVAALLEPLLYDNNAEIRTAVLRYIIEKYSKEELEQLLRDYVGEARYYYNVVCWIDRALYAPQPLREMFIRTINSY